MKKIIISIVLFAVFGWCVTVLADYCDDYYQEYRDIKYWADKRIDIRDQNYGSGDALSLKLVSKGKYSTKPSKEIVDHFNNEFNRLIKGDLPFHNAKDEAFHRSFNAVGRGNMSLDEFYSRERARRRSLYGSNPAVLYCEIKIKNSKFPILYYIECQISTDEDLHPYGCKMEMEDMGFSTPEYIEGELKTAITEQLEKLAGTMKKINECSQTPNP